MPTKKNEVSTTGGFALTTFEQVEAFAEKVATSGMLGPCTKAQAFVITEHCAKKGLSVLEFKQRYHTTKEGGILIRADYMQANFQRMGGKIRWIESTDKIAKAAFSYGDNVDWVQSYTWEQAERAGLAKKDTYKAHPEDLLRKNLVAKTINAICPEAKEGYYVAEEMPDEPTQTAPRGEPVPVDVQVRYNTETETPSEQHEPEAVDVEVVEPEADPAPKKGKAAKKGKDTPAPKKTKASAAEPEDAEVVEDAAPAPEADTDPSPFDNAPAKPDVDYSICPMPYLKRNGVPFTDFPLDHLEKVMQAKHPDMEPGHYSYVNELINTKKGN